MPTMSITNESASIGKWRRLQQSAGERDTFSILAIDHRRPLRRTLREEISTADTQQDTNAQTDIALTDLKRDVVRAIAPLATAVLLDPETGAGPCVTCADLNGQTGLITALDTGSTGDPQHLETGLVSGWSVEKAAKMGAAGVKLLVYYHPEASDASQVEDLVRNVVQDCGRYEIPFFLEPLSYSLDNQKGALPSAERREVVVETARRLAPLGVDILKMEFPIDAKEQSDEREWKSACQQLSDACTIPWVLLSAGVSFETFLRQTHVACDCGASGIMVGRAVWKEAVTTNTASRNEFLNSVGSDRMRRLRAICDAFARPFTDLVRRPNTDADWYKSYS
jgi:tagatose-1,6-bisphosphate aldolase